MTGYQEVLTDPSYAGQIVTMTYPLIGNYGVNAEDEESARAAGGRLRDPRGAADLQQLAGDGVAGGVPGAHTAWWRSPAWTRARSPGTSAPRGAMRGAIAPGETATARQLLARSARSRRWRGWTSPAASPRASGTWCRPRGESASDVLAFDFGVKSHSLKLLAERGCEVTVLPGTTRPAGGDPGRGRGRALHLQRPGRPGGGGARAGGDPRRWRSAGRPSSGSASGTS
jgi:carbamoyl-phosphate synthase small subunit